jgi:hypothetical protein
VTSTDDASDNLAGFQSSQFETLRAILDKRSEEDAAPSEIAEEFASLWLPSLAVDLELLVPAVRQAQLDQTKTSAAAVQKDLINILLANLVRERNADGRTKAILEALSSVFSKYERAAQKERQGLGDNEGDLGRKMKHRFERLSDNLSTWIKPLERPWICWRRVASPFLPLGVPAGSLTWLDTQATVRIETSKGALSRMTIVDPLATRAAAAADRAGMKKAASLRMIIVDLTKVRVAAGADQVGMKRAAS